MNKFKNGSEVWKIDGLYHNASVTIIKVRYIGSFRDLDGRNRCEMRDNNGRYYCTESEIHQSLKEAKEDVIENYNAVISNLKDRLESFENAKQSIESMKDIREYREEQLNNIMDD